MCGIGGYMVNPKLPLAKKTQNKFAEALQELHAFLDSRGGHAAGLVLNTRKSFSVKHINGLAVTLPPDIYKTETPLWALCHTRLGTVGALSAKNAHPHLVGPIIGVHNGNIRNWEQIKTKESLKIKGDHTDSHVLWYLIQKKLQSGTRNLVTAAEQAIKQAEGSATIVLGSTKNPNTLLFFRQNNPLYLLYIPELRSLWWASEHWMFYALSDMGIIPYSEIESNLTELPERQIVGFNAYDLGKVPRYFIRKSAELKKPQFRTRSPLAIWPRKAPSDCCMPSCTNKLGKRFWRFVYRSKKYDICEDCLEWNEEMLELLDIHTTRVYRSH